MLLTWLEYVCIVGMSNDLETGMSSKSVRHRAMGFRLGSGLGLASRKPKAARASARLPNAKTRAAMQEDLSGAKRYKSAAELFADLDAES